MNGKHGLVLSMATVLALGAWGFSQADKPAKEGAAANKTEKKEAKANKEATKRPVRLAGPWGKLESLSDEQKAKIADIQKATAEAKKALDEKEKNDIMAMLSDQQKEELKQMQAKDEEARKAKREEAKKGEGKAEAKEPKADKK